MKKSLLFIGIALVLVAFAFAADLQQIEKNITEKDLPRNITLDNGVSFERKDAKSLKFTKDKTSFSVTSTADIIEVGDIKKTKEWGYNALGYQIETLESNKSLFAYDDNHICLTETRESSNPLFFGGEYPCIYYPDQWYNISGEMKNLRTIKRINDTRFEITFYGKYDPQLTYVSFLRAYYPLNETNGSFYNYQGVISNKQLFTGTPNYVSGSDCTDGLQCIRTFNATAGNVGLFRDAYNGSATDSLIRAGKNKTILFWVNISDTFSAGSWTHLFGDNSDDGLVLRISSGGEIYAMIRLTDNNWQTITLGDVPSLRGQWHLYSAYWDNTSTKLGGSIDCNNMNNFSSAYSLGDKNPTQFEYIGSNGGLSTAVNGTYQHLAIYERLLSQSECESYMNITGNIGGGDSTPPTLSFGYNYSGSYELPKTFNFSANWTEDTAVDKGRITFNFSKSNATYSLTGASGNFFNITKMLLGTYNITAYVNDTAGNKVQSSLVITMVDTTKPSNNITINNSSPKTGSSLNISVTWTDNYNATQCIFTNNVTSHKATQTISGTSGTCSFNISVLSKGTVYNLTTNITDESGNNQANWSVLAVQNSNPAISTQNSFHDSTAGHNFTVTASASDADGGSDIVSTAIAASSGSCQYLSNSSSGNYFNVTYNCSGTALATNVVRITFTDSSSASVDTALTGNQYPNQAPALSYINLNDTSLIKSETLLATPTSSDADSDAITNFFRFSNSTATLQDYSTNATFNCNAYAGCVAGETITVTGYANDSYTISGTATNSTTVASTVPTLLLAINFTNASTSHSYLAFANATEIYDTITQITNNASSCLLLGNSSSGNNVGVTYNCSGTALTSETITIAFNNSLGESVSTTGSNVFPNNVPSASYVQIASSAYKSSTLSPSGSSSDADSDSLTEYFAFANSTATLQNSTTATFDCSAYAGCIHFSIINISYWAGDGFQNSSIVYNSTTILNSLPTGTLSGNISNGTAFYDANATIYLTGLIDADSDTIYCEFWTQGGLAQNDSTCLYSTNWTAYEDSKNISVNVTDGFNYSHYALYTFSFAATPASTPSSSSSSSSGVNPAVLSGNAQTTRTVTTTKEPENNFSIIQGWLKAARENKIASLSIIAMIVILGAGGTVYVFNSNTRRKARKTMQVNPVSYRKV